MTSDKLESDHLDRWATLYVRQSSSRNLFIDTAIPRPRPFIEMRMPVAANMPA